MAGQVRIPVTQTLTAFEHSQIEHFGRTFTDPAPPAGSAFYRVVLLP